MPKEWNVGESDMRPVLEQARTAGHTRLFAIAYDKESPVQWHHRQDEAAMTEFLDSREESESMFFNCAIAIVVVNPQDTDETIESVIASHHMRNDAGSGYFEEAF